MVVQVESVEGVSLRCEKLRQRRIKEIVAPAVEVENGTASLVCTPLV